MTYRPKFNGKDAKEFRNYISGNLEFPDQAKKYKLSGTVFIRFVVNSKGEVKNVEIIKGIDPLLDEAVIKAVKSSPIWEPGRQGIIPVNVRFTFPIKFVLL